MIPLKKKAKPKAKEMPMDALKMAVMEKPKKGKGKMPMKGKKPC